MNSKRQCFLLFSVMLFLVKSVSGQEFSKEYSEDRLKSAAHEIMIRARYCALITIDQDGKPRARTMDPFEPDSSFTVWFGTNIHSRKVLQIKYDPRVTLYYFEPQSEGYVVIQGTAHLVNDPGIKKIYWKEEWTEFYPNPAEDYLLIQVIPDRLEISSTNHGIYSDPETWEPPSIIFKKNKQP